MNYSGWHYPETHSKVEITWSHPRQPANFRQSRVSKPCNYHLWTQRRIRHMFTQNLANTLACNIVSARHRHNICTFHSHVTGTKITLRSSSYAPLTVPTTRTVCATPAFIVCMPVFWNSLHLCDTFSIVHERLETFILRTAHDI